MGGGPSLLALVFVFGTINFGTYFKAVTLCKPILALGKPSPAIDTVLLYGDVSNASALAMKFMTELFLVSTAGFIHVSAKSPVSLIRTPISTAV